MDDTARTEIKKRLLTYPGVTEKSVDSDLDAYEERSELKTALIKERKFSNALAESYLDKKGLPRPPRLALGVFLPGQRSTTEWLCDLGCGNRPCLVAPEVTHHLGEP